MIVALIDSGLGMLPTAAWLRRKAPDLDLLLLTDPDGAPWGPKPRTWVIDRVLSTAQRAVNEGAEVVVLPCNTASVTALADVRAELEPGVPVIGTVPAIKPAAALFPRFAVWATEATTASAYQAGLIAQFAPNAEVTAVACPGLAESIDRGDRDSWLAAIADAARRTPVGIEAIVLGCTHYPLVAGDISTAVGPECVLFDSAEAVAAQTLRRIETAGLNATGGGKVRVIASFVDASLPSGAEHFDAGRELADRS